MNFTTDVLFNFSPSGDVVFDLDALVVKGGASYTAGGNAGGTLILENNAGFRKIIFERFEIDNIASTLVIELMG